MVCVTNGGRHVDHSFEQLRLLHVRHRRVASFELSTRESVAGTQERDLWGCRHEGSHASTWHTGGEFSGIPEHGDLLGLPAGAATGCHRPGRDPASFLVYHARVRCFVALDLPSPVCNYLAGLAGQFQKKGDVKWVPADQLHVTLVFAGDVGDATVDALREVVRTIAVPPLSLSLQGLGHFPPRGEPRVVWAALGGDVAALTALQAELAEHAERLEIPREKRGFVPHVTLGRVRSAFGALALIDQLKTVGASLEQKPFAPTGLVLYRSELRPGGPIHTPLLRRPSPRP
jgi:2'-5' RNA ligase